MLSRREVLQVAAATAAILPGLRAAAWRRRASAKTSSCASIRSATSRSCTSPTCMASSCRSISASRRSISASARQRGLVPHLAGRAYLERFGIADRSAAAYALTADDFERARQRLRPHRRARPRRHGGQARARRTGRQGAAARRRRHLAGLARREPHQGPGHGRLLPAARARRDDRPLGVHLRRSPREGARRRPRVSLPRAQRPRHRVGGAGVRALSDVRGGRRQDRGARPGLSLHAGRQSALDDPEMVVRHPRGGRARQRREGARARAPSLSCCCRTTASTSTASSPRASPAST